MIKLVKHIGIFGIICTPVTILSYLVCVLRDNTYQNKVAPQKRLEKSFNPDPSEVNKIIAGRIIKK